MLHFVLQIISQQKRSQTRESSQTSTLSGTRVMPKMGCRAVLEHVRKTRPGTEVLMISGYANDDVPRQGIALDPFRFLQKPFTFQALSARIREMIGKSSS